MTNENKKVKENKKQLFRQDRHIQSKISVIYTS